MKDSNNLDSWFEENGLSSRKTVRLAQLDVAKQNNKILSLEGDLAMPSVPFGEVLPKQFIQMGISEANIIGVSTGLSMRGFIPFVNSFASFLAMRACEQIRIDVAYHNANVKIVGYYSGISGGAAGSTHHCIEDIAIIRSMPNMVLLNPADSYEAYKATMEMAKYNGPVYMRVGRADTPRVYKQDYEFKIGKSVMLKDGEDATIIASGNRMVHDALEASKLLEEEGINCRVINMHTIKPLDKEAIIKAAQDTNCIVTVEEHNVHGGLGSAVAEVIQQNHPVPLSRVGIEDVFCMELGPYEEMLPVYGLDPINISSKVKNTFNRKHAVAN